MITLEQYIRKNYQNGVIDHAIRINVDGKGRANFYIHPAIVSGDTLDFNVKGNRLSARFRKIGICTKCGEEIWGEYYVTKRGRHHKFCPSATPDPRDPSIKKAKEGK